MHVIMDSTNNFHHHDEQQQQHHFSPLITTSYGLSTSLQWNPTLLSTTSSDTFCSKVYPNLEPSYQQSTNNNNNFPKSEEDMLSSFPSFTTLMMNNPTNIMENSCSFNGFGLDNNPMHTNTRSGLMQFPLDQHHHHNTSYNNDDNNTPINNWMTNNHHHHHSFPSSNIFHQLGLVSSPNNSTTSISSSSPRLGLNMHAMDLLGTSNATFGSHVLHEDAFAPTKKTAPNDKGSTLITNGGLSGTKRAAAGSCSPNDQSKASSTSTNKKSQHKPSCPPLKVRKEKLGDRIAALHQLVSPFGKTDTASVLTEAIGYIQFLQDQIHTFCMPNDKPSRKPFQMENEDDENDEDDTQTDIRRRGLCLVPVSWTSYITPNQFDASSNNPFF